MSRDWSKYVGESSNWLALGPLLAAFSGLIASEIGETEGLIFLVLITLSMLGQNWWKRSLLTGGILTFGWTVTLYSWKFPAFFSSEFFLIWGSGTSFLLALTVTALGKIEAEYKLLTQQRLIQKGLLARKEVLESELGLKNQEIRATEQRLFEQQRINALHSKESEEQRQGFQRELTEKRAEVMEYQHQQQLAHSQLHAIKQQHEVLSTEFEAASKSEEKLKEREELYQQLEHSHSELMKEQESLNQIIAHQFVKIENFDQEQEVRIAKIAALEKELGSLKELTSEQQKTHSLLEQVILERDHLQQELERKGASALEKELKRSQGMYKQLQEQFEEKNMLLEESRKALFMAEQAKDTLQIELKEVRLEVESDSLRLISEAHDTIRKQEQEIEALEALVSTNIN